jgi:polysaccharide export outer membrane protein
MKLGFEIGNFFSVIRVKRLCMKAFKCFLWCILVFSVSGCSHQTNLRNAAFLADKDYIMGPSVPTYKLGFGDLVEVKFFNNERFNNTVRVRPDGYITLEKVGDIFVSGMTPAQLDSVVTKTYSEIIRDPDVTVIVREFGGYEVYVLGEVFKPGGYAIGRNMTMLQALAAAGGSKESAKLSSVILLRRGTNERVNAIKFDLNRALKGNGTKITDRDLYVQAADIIYVPETFISNVSTFLSEVYAGVLPPVDAYLRALLYRTRR